ncbi:MAG: 50S ribosomal protein L30e [archaeon]
MDHAEAGKEIRRAVDTGKVLFGGRESTYALRHGEGQLLIVTHNAPPLVLDDLKHTAYLSEIPVYVFKGTGLELGSVCGKPYVISTLLVLDGGKSKVQDLATQKDEGKTVAPKTTRGRKKKGV